MVHAASNVINAAVFFVFVILPQGVFAEDLLGFLIFSTPKSGKISYVKLPSNGHFEDLEPIDLLGPSGLHHPQGLAVDHKRKRLFIADPDVQKVYYYQLAVKGNTLTCDGKQTIISEGAEARWVSVDGMGNVFFSDEPRNTIYKITGSKILRGNGDAEVLYDGESFTQVNRPGGIAVDNFHVFWTNKHDGIKSGAVVRGDEVLPTGIDSQVKDSLSVLAANVPKSYGVCLAYNNVFFTDSERRIYGVKKTGGQVHVVSSMFKNPRGCVWDGDGTVFVADRGNGAVYSFAGNMHQITHQDVSKAFDMDDVFGLAFMSSATRLCSWLAFVCCFVMSFV